MGQYNLMFEQEEFTELVRLYSELEIGRAHV